MAYVDTLQCILLAMGIMIYGAIALNAAGGWDSLQEGLAKLAASDVGKWGTTKGFGGGDYNAYFAIPGVIQWTAGLGKETPVGGLWTGIMCLTYMFALMGIQSAPAFTMWSFSNTDPRPFAPQQVWASSFGIGFILFFFTAFTGMGGHLLGANPAVTDAGLALSNALPGSIAAKPDSIVPHYHEHDLGFLSVAGRLAGGLRAGGHAVHGRRLHVDGGRYPDAGPVQALPEPGFHAQHAEAGRAHGRRLYRRQRAPGGDVLA